MHGAKKHSVIRSFVLVAIGVVAFSNYQLNASQSQFTPAEKIVANCGKVFGKYFSPRKEGSTLGITEDIPTCSKSAVESHALIQQAMKIAYPEESLFRGEIPVELSGRRLLDQARHAINLFAILRSGMSSTLENRIAIFESERSRQIEEADQRLLRLQRSLGADYVPRDVAQAYSTLEIARNEGRTNLDRSFFGPIQETIKDSLVNLAKFDESLEKLDEVYFALLIIVSDLVVNGGLNPDNAEDKNLIDTIFYANFSNTPRIINSVQSLERPLLRAIRGNAKWKFWLRDSRVRDREKLAKGYFAKLNSIRNIATKAGIDYARNAGQAHILYQMVKLVTQGSGERRLRARGIIAQLLEKEGKELKGVMPSFLRSIEMKLEDEGQYWDPSTRKRYPIPTEIKKIKMPDGSEQTVQVPSFAKLRETIGDEGRIHQILMANLTSESLVEEYRSEFREFFQSLDRWYLTGMQAGTNFERLYNVVESLKSALLRNKNLRIADVAMGSTLVMSVSEAWASTVNQMLKPEEIKRSLFRGVRLKPFTDASLFNASHIAIPSDWYNTEVVQRIGGVNTESGVDKPSVGFFEWAKARLGEGGSAAVGSAGLTQVIALILNVLDSYAYEIDKRSFQHRDEANRGVAITYPQSEIDRMERELSAAIKDFYAMFRTSYYTQFADVKVTVPGPKGGTQERQIEDADIEYSFIKVYLANFPRLSDFVAEAHFGKSGLSLGLISEEIWKQIGSQVFKRTGMGFTDGLEFQTPQGENQGKWSAKRWFAASVISVALLTGSITFGNYVYDRFPTWGREITKPADSQKPDLPKPPTQPGDPSITVPGGRGFPPNMPSRPGMTPTEGGIGAIDTPVAPGSFPDGEPEITNDGSTGISAPGSVPAVKPPKKRSPTDFKPGENSAP